MVAPSVAPALVYQLRRGAPRAHPPLAVVVNSGFMDADGGLN
jgi:hypothetical protein